MSQNHIINASPEMLANCGGAVNSFDMERLYLWSRAHWFYLLVIPILGAAFALHELFEWERTPLQGEIIAMVMWCILTPSLFALCYWDMPIRALILRITALFCGGAWMAGVTVPDHAEQLLREWGWLRYLGIALLALVEGVALLAVLRMLFGGNVDESELLKQGIPPLVAKVMLAEARFWRWVWRRLTAK